MTIRDVAELKTTQDIDGGVANLREGESDTARVVAALPVRHVEHPENAVLDPPMLA